MMINKAGDVTSSFVIYLSTKNNNDINNKLIKPKIKKFFDSLNINYYHEIHETGTVSDLDFKIVDFSFFYEKVFFDISKTDMTVNVIPKYCITVDKNNCKILCPKTNIYHDLIVLNKTPVLYFIYVDINEIITFMRQCKNDQYFNISNSR